MTESAAVEPVAAAEPVVAPLPPATGSEKAAWILTGAGILFVLGFHLVPALVAGLLAHTLLHRTARLLQGPRLSHGAAKFLSVALIVVFAAGASTGLVLLLVSFGRGRVGALPTLFQKVADGLDQARTHLQSWGIGVDFLDGMGAGQVQSAASDWLRDHSSELTRAGGEIGRFVLHAVMGIVVGMLVFFRHGEPLTAPLAVSLGERVRRLAGAFEDVVLAQFEISALNTVLTGIYLFGVLPLLGAPLPLSGTLLALTFMTGLLPVIGNLLSNTAIVALSLGVAPWVALVSLGFLVAIHKLEYFVNARIVGARIGAAAWEILLAMVVFEVSFGLAGVVLAPILYAYVKKELIDRRLV